MNKIILLLVALAAFSAQRAMAQNFTDHIEAEVEGQGSVDLVQDPRLESIVNGDVSTFVAAPKADKGVTRTQTGKRQKMRGYRIQMYWGNSQRTDQLKAQRLGAQVTSAYPELRAYTSFASPHWQCRVGDFATREEAAEYLTKLRRISRDAMIVRSEIFVYQ